MVVCGQGTKKIIQNKTSVQCAHPQEQGGLSSSLSMSAGYSSRTPGPESGRLKCAVVESPIMITPILKAAKNDGVGCRERGGGDKNKGG